MMRHSRVESNDSLVMLSRVDDTIAAAAVLLPMTETYRVVGFACVVLGRNLSHQNSENEQDIEAILCTSARTAEAASLRASL